MSSQLDSHTDHSVYYVPAQSRFPIWLSVGLITTVFGIGVWLNAAKAGESHTPWIFAVGFSITVLTLFNWFRTVVDENHAGLPNAQVKRSYVWGMGWFIFSEVMFFAAFFGALFYTKYFALPWLAGEGEKGITGQVLWPEFAGTGWGEMTNPDSERYHPPHESMAAPPMTAPGSWASYLPFWNTVILVTSSFTVHLAHHALKEGHRVALRNWLVLTVALGFVFVVLQGVEYAEAYAHMGLTLNSGIYGSTFFLLTGFHGFHVILGATMLSVMLWRVFLGHFKPDDHFGFEAASWYWHFVDVVWLFLFFVVYIGLDSVLFG
jgi:cytochrome c oxidase subunit 3